MRNCLHQHLLPLQGRDIQDGIIVWALPQDAVTRVAAGALLLQVLELWAFSCMTCLGAICTLKPGILLPGRLHQSRQYTSPLAGTSLARHFVWIRSESVHFWHAGAQPVPPEHQHLGAQHPDAARTWVPLPRGAHSKRMAETLDARQHAV